MEKKQILIDLSPGESDEFDREFESLGYEVIHIDDRWMKEHSAMKGLSAEGIAPEKEKEMILAHDLGGEWDQWIVAVCMAQEHIDRMQENKIAAIGFEKPGQPWLSCDYIVQSLDAVEEKDLEEAFCRCHGLPLTVIRTERTILREFAMSDLDSLIRLYSEPNMTDYMDGIYPKDQEKEYEKAYIDTGYRFFGYGMWVVIDKETAELIGRAGVENSELCHEAEAELGYAVSEKFRGKGIATEVCTAILEYCFEELSMERIFARVDPENKPSKRVLMKLGFAKLSKKNAGSSKFSEDIYQKPAVR